MVSKYLGRLRAERRQIQSEPVYPEISRKFGKEFTLITHLDGFKALEGIRKGIDHEDHLCLLFITKNLRYVSNSRVDKRINKFKINFEEEFGNAVAFYEGDSKAENKHNFMAFIDVKHALFAFVYLDVLEIQADFIKEEELKRIEHLPHN